MIVYRTKDRTYTYEYHDDFLYKKICNELHSPDNNTPAEEHSIGSKTWYKNGKVHRDDDLPAFIGCTGIQQYYQYGVLHRENGPAEIHPCGVNLFYLNGKYYQNIHSWFKDHPNQDNAFHVEMILKYT
jgi:hypothetical protein